MVPPRGALEIHLTQFSPTYKPEFPSSQTSFLMCLQGSHRTLMPTQGNGDPKMPLVHSFTSGRRETATQCPQDVQRNCSSKLVKSNKIRKQSTCDAASPFLDIQTFFLICICIFCPFQKRDSLSTQHSVPGALQNTFEEWNGILDYTSQSSLVVGTLGFFFLWFAV